MVRRSSKAYLKALYLNPDNLDYRYSLAYLYFDKKDYPRALKEVDAILDSQPEHSQARVLKGLLLAQNKIILKLKIFLKTTLKRI